MAYGLTETGFIKKRQPEIQAEIAVDLRTVFGSQLNLLPTAIFGQLVGIFSEREALLWELLELVYNSAYPDTATGASLDNAVALTGTRRLEATYSQVTARVMGTPGTVIPKGMVFSVAGIPTSKFATVLAGTIGTGINEVQSLTFGAVPSGGTFQLNFDGQTTASIAFNASNAAIASALVALSNLAGITVTGTMATALLVEFTGADGQKNQPLLTVTNNLLVNGVGAPVSITVAEHARGYLPFVDIEARAQSLGIVAAPSGTLTVVETPLFGVDSVVNVLDAIVGRERETEAELRIRRLESLQRAGTATINGVVTTVRQLPGVEAAFVFENFTDAIVDGRPPKSYEVYVQGGQNEDILRTVWETKPAGIQLVGNFSGSVIDSQGFLQPVYFSRPVEVLIYLRVTVTKNLDPSEPGGVYPPNGDALVRDAVLAYGAAFEIGQNVVLSRFFSGINLIPGVVGIVIQAGTSPNPAASANISIAPTQYARFDASRLEVVSL